VSYFVGPGRAQAMLLDPQPMTARQAKDLGVVAEIVPRGERSHGKRDRQEPARQAGGHASQHAHPLRAADQRATGSRGRIRPGARGASAAALVKSFQTKGNE